MAYIPDEAIEKMSEVSDSAFKMFAYFCKRRNSETGLCFPSLKTTAADCGLSYGHASVTRKELVVKEWIEIIEERLINCLKGFRNSKDSLENLNPSLEFLNTPLEILNPIYKEVLNQDNITKTINQEEGEPPSSPKTEVPKKGEGKKTEGRKSAKAKNARDLKTRPDLSDEDYLVWLSQIHPGIHVPGMYQDLVEWCRKKGKTPTRQRLLRWIQKEASESPMTFAPKENNESRNGNNGGNNQQTSDYLASINARPL